MLRAFHSSPSLVLTSLKPLASSGRPSAWMDYGEGIDTRWNQPFRYPAVYSPARK